MGLPAALALLVLGLLVGQIWARRSRGLWGRGTARPGVALAALTALVGALVTGVRGLWPEALALLAGAAVLAGTARLRPFAAPPRGAKRAEAAGSSQLTVEQAASLLGVAPDASPEQVQTAYRRLIRVAHPDQGGTAGLAAQLTAARAVMLGRR